MKRKTNPNTLAALEPYKWRPGVSGNPKGTRSGSWSVREHMLQLLQQDDEGKGHTRADLEAIAENPKSTGAKVIAARRLLNAMSSGKRFVIGKDGVMKEGSLDPECGRDADRVMDRTDGKAPQRIEVSHEQKIDLPAMIREAQAIARQLGPIKVNAMIEGLQAKLAASEGHALVDTTATPIDDDPDAEALSEALNSV